MSAKVINLATKKTHSPEYKGQYLRTIERPLKSGIRYEFWFKPPQSVRPREWDQRYRAAIRLPRDGELRTGRDPETDPREYAAAFSEAADLFAEMNRLREAPDGGGAWPRGTLRWLIQEWQKSEWFTEDLAETTRRNYEQQIASIVEWADRKAVENNAGLPLQVHRLTPKGVANFFHEFDDRPTKRGHVRRVLKNLCSYAIELGLRNDNPVDGVVMRRTKGAKRISALWDQAFVDACAEWAYANDHPEAAAMVLLMWDCGRRPADIFRLIAMNDMDRQALINGTLNSAARPMLYDPHRRAIMGWVAKTGNYIEIPLDEPTIAPIAHVCPDPNENRRHLFVHQKTGEPYDQDTWKWIWWAMRDHAAKTLKAPAYKTTTWQKGRASSIVRNKRAGLDDADIITLSDHSNPKTVYKHYWTPDDTQAAEAKKRRREAEEKQ
ncbi:MAG: hypothetical protein VX529_10435 [Pseudomonadota bacterium]|nr:hypothetical protein [Pseudomonadota bacterium]